MGLRYVLFSPKISSFQPKNSRRGEFFFFTFVQTSAFLNICYFLERLHILMVLNMENNIYITV